MGSGSSRSRRKRSCSPGADRPGRWGRSSSAPSWQGEEAKGSQAPAPTELPSSSLRRPQPGGPAEDSDWELLEEVLAECEEPGALLPTARGAAAPIPGPPRRGPAGDSWAGHDRHSGAVAAGSGRGSGAAGGDQPKMNVGPGPRFLSVTDKVSSQQDCRCQQGAQRYQLSLQVPVVGAIPGLLNKKHTGPREQQLLR
ncbi:cystin-1 isoform X2 [Terrapene carolina triunguis]|uniref:cystin-1 isoform X1 n=1 Tax=Terrapene triunguis TaxID=2587831 RepID=UPI000E77DA05|nr:cystin-1 isoform X1 [Terrapene carolina triunguis]XP_024054899.2 cystin-1 isoform X2 [Terrapene carolina triunguis]